MNFQEACDHILDRLARELPADLTYHNLTHTRDVMAQADRIARAEGIADAESLAILQTAAAYHDAGFLYIYDEHEAESCRIASAALPNFGYSAGQIEIVCQLIRATRIPQSPTDHLSEILCDADLDYLGRADYAPISETLRAEWTALGRLPDASRWLPIQQGFLGKHQYFTASSRILRTERKQQTLSGLE